MFKKSLVIALLFFSSILFAAENYIQVPPDSTGKKTRTLKRRRIIKSGVGIAKGTSDAIAIGEAIWQAEFSAKGISKAEARTERILSPTDEEALLTLLLAA